MILGTSPFDETDIILATHHHVDHYSSISVGECLFNQSNVKFVSTQQALDKLKEHKEYFSKIEKQIFLVTPDLYQSSNIQFDGLDVKVLRFKHSSYFEENEFGEKVDRHAHVQNLGFIIRSDDLTVFHCGDAGTDYRSLYWIHLTARSSSLSLRC
jgi:L-ascorbate metabolism protein UlaG (beta-lactamase superfamily)